MSKINAIRLINLNYNNNAIKISDETFHLNGDSTLLSLRNGGGKSVLVQMMTAPFVHKLFRRAMIRPFSLILLFTQRYRFFGYMLSHLLY